MDRSADLALALDLADVADALSMRWFRSDDLGESTKADGSVVTAADVQVETRLRDLLAEHRPGDGVLGEEFGGTDDHHRVWMLDPIDGTAAFVTRSWEWATLISLMEDGVPVVGVISMPASSTRWWAAEGCGAFRDGRQLRVSRTERFAEAVLTEDFRHSITRELTWNPLAALSRAARAVVPTVNRFTFCPIASGAADVHLAWWAGSGPDLTGPICIVTEAGGRFSHLDGRTTTDEGVHLVTNGHLHDETTARVRQLIDDLGLDPTPRPTEDVDAILAVRAKLPSPDPITQPNLWEPPRPSN